MSPGRPNAHPGRTPAPKRDPLAPQYPKKRHSPAPPVPSAASSNPTHVPPLHPACAISTHQSAPNPAISPPLLKYTHIRATLAYARDRTRGPETQPSNGVRPRAIRRGVPRGRTGAVKTRLSNPAPSPLSSVLLCHAVPLLCPKNPLQHYRFARDRRHPQLRGAQNVAETNRLPAFAWYNGVGGHQVI